VNDVTQILNAAAQGEAGAVNELLSLVYEELRRLAAVKMALESPGQTLQPTALVHEVWLRLTNDDQRQWNDRTHFFAAAAEAMRRILVDNARRKRTERHGGSDGLQRTGEHNSEPGWWNNSWPGGSHGDAHGHRRGRKYRLVYCECYRGG